MNDIENLFDEDTVETISNLVENKMPLLNQVPAFKEKDQKLSTLVEELEDVLSEELNNKLDNAIRLQYQLDSYYFTLAYYIGKQHGDPIKKI